MEVIDLIRLSFRPMIALEDSGSMAGRVWQATLQYILRHKGDPTLYWGRQSEDEDIIWMFLRKSSWTFDRSGTLT